MLSTYHPKKLILLYKIVDATNEDFIIEPFWLS